jgi:hypothetical protein
MLPRDARAFGVADLLRCAERRRLAALGDADRVLGREVPRMEEIEVGKLARQQVRVGQAGRLVLGGVARDRHGGVDGLLERGAR